MQIFIDSNYSYILPLSLCFRYRFTSRIALKLTQVSFTYISYTLFYFHFPKILAVVNFGKFTFGWFFVSSCFIYTVSHLFYWQWPILAHQSSNDTAQIGIPTLQTVYMFCKQRAVGTNNTTYRQHSILQINSLYHVTPFTQPLSY